MSTPLRERPDAPLGTLIFRAGLLPAETIESALEEGVKTGKRLGEILTERGLLKEVDLARLLAGQKGLEFVPVREHIVDPAAASLFTHDQARLFRALPYAFEEGVPVVAIPDPTDDVVLRNIREALGRDEVRFVVSTRGELAEIVEDVYSKPLAVQPTAAPEPAPMPPPAAEPSFVQNLDPPSPPEAEPRPDPASSNGNGNGASPDAAADLEPEPIASGPPSEPAAPLEVVGAAPVEPALAAPAVEEQTAPLSPVAPEPPSAHEPPAASEEVAPAAPATVPAEPVAVQAEPVVTPEPAPVPEHVSSPEPVPPLQPVLSPEPPAPAAPSPAPVPLPEPVSPPAPEPYPPAASGPAAADEPAPASGTLYEVTIRLANGERVEAGAFQELGAAKERAKELMAQVAAAGQVEWPFVSGRFLKPDTIVSVDIAEHAGGLATS